MVCTGDSSSASEPAMSAMISASAGGSSSGGPGTPGTPNDATSMSSDVIVNVGGRQRQARFLVRRLTVEFWLNPKPLEIKCESVNVF